VGVGESQPFARQSIEVRRRDAPGRVERPDIAVAEIVSEDQDDVRPCLRRADGDRGGSSDQGGDEVAHPRILHRSPAAINSAAAAVWGRLPDPGANVDNHTTLSTGEVG
jgi:hypothetical protein